MADGRSVAYEPQPALERCIEFRADWILQMYARNLGLMLLVAGGLHLYFYTFGRQGAERKFDPRGVRVAPAPHPLSHAVGSVARLQSRRHAASHGRPPKAPARTDAAPGRTDVTPAGRDFGTPVLVPHRARLAGAGADPPVTMDIGRASRPTPACEAGP